MELGFAEIGDEAWQFRAPFAGGLELRLGRPGQPGRSARLPGDSKVGGGPLGHRAYLGKHLQPVNVVDSERLARFIRDLGSDWFGVRERATQELRNLGEQAVAACHKALKQPPSEEGRRRLEKLLDGQRNALFNPEGERLQALRALEVLELVGTAQASQVLEALAKVDAASHGFAGTSRQLKSVALTPRPAQQRSKHAQHVSQPQHERRAGNREERHQ